MIADYNIIFVSKNRDKVVSFLTAFEEWLVGIPIEGAKSYHLANHGRLNNAIVACIQQQFCGIKILKMFIL